MIRLVVFVLLLVLALVTHNLPTGGLGMIGGIALLMWITDWTVGAGTAVRDGRP